MSAANKWDELWKDRVLSTQRTENEDQILAAVTALNGPRLQKRNATVTLNLVTAKNIETVKTILDYLKEQILADETKQKALLEALMTTTSSSSSSSSSSVMTITVKKWYVPIYSQVQIDDVLGKLVLSEERPMSSIGIKAKVPPPPSLVKVSRKKMINNISKNQSVIFKQGPPRLTKKDIDFVLKCASNPNNKLLQSLSTWCLADHFKKLEFIAPQTEEAMKQFIEVES